MTDRLVWLIAAFTWISGFVTAAAIAYGFPGVFGDCKASEVHEALQAALYQSTQRLDAIKDVDWRKIPKGGKVCVRADGRVTR